MRYKWLAFLVIVILVFISSCGDLFQNGDLGFLAETARGDITVSDPAVTPSLFQKRTVTNISLSIKATSPYEVVSVEADLSALGGGTVNLLKSGDTWSASLYFQSENAGNLAIRFIAKSKTGKIGMTNYNVNVITYGSVYVATNGSDANEGLTSSNAVRSLQKGIDIAAEKGIYEVLVSTGIYDQSANGICANLRSGLNIKGGYDLTFSSRNIVSTPSVIDGLGTATHVIAAYSVQNTIMDGFIIRNGNASGVVGFDGCGGGLLAINSTVSIYGMNLSNNTAGKLGGGFFIYNSQISSSNCQYSANRAEKGGGLGIISSALNILDSVLRNNYSADLGGAIYAYSSSIHMDTNRFVDNTCIAGGGAVYSKMGNCAIEHSEFNGNHATNSYWGGGAVQVEEGGLTVTTSAFISNLAIQSGSQVIFGGAISIFQCSGPAITDCQFYANTCTNYGSQAGGGGIGMCRSSNIVVQDCTFTGNIGTAGGAICNNKIYGSGVSVYSLLNNRFYSNVVAGSSPYGGAIYDDSGVVTMNGNVFSYNSAGYYAGGIYATGGSLTMNNNILSNNYSQTAGAVYISQATASFVTNLFFNNICEYEGGAVKLVDGFYTMDRCLFIGNGATNGFSGSGGSIHIYQSSFYSSHTATINNSYFSNDFCGGYGGAIYIWSSNVNLAGSVFYGNTSGYGGGAVHVNRGNCTVNSCVFSFNRTTNATFGGGALEAFQGYLEVYNSTLSYNFGDLGGAIKVGESGISSLVLQGGTISYHTNYAIYTNTNSCTYSMSGVNFTGNYPGDINN